MRALIISVLVSMASLDALADTKAGEKKAQLCLLCHKPGNVNQAAPLLEAQPAKYLVAAIIAYKTRKRPDPGMQTNVASLSARDIRDIAEYFASRPLPSGVHAADAGKAGLGESRVRELKCGTCHGDAFGGSGNVPRLAGQTTGYLIAQLEAFATNRSEHPLVETTFSRIGDVEAIAHYFTTLK
jgi:cytochrome c553